MGKRLVLIIIYLNVILTIIFQVIQVFSFKGTIDHDLSFAFVVTYLLELFFMFISLKALLKYQRKGGLFINSLKVYLLSQMISIFLVMGYTLGLIVIFPVFSWVGLCFILSSLFCLYLHKDKVYLAFVAWGISFLIFTGNIYESFWFTSEEVALLI